MTIRICEQDFDLTTEIAGLRAGHPQVGAVVAFVGTVRDMNDGAPVSAMTLEHYPGMTEKSIQAIIDLAHARWPLSDTLVIHRIGPLLPQEQIVLVAVTSAHRGEAFAACEFIMDYLKSEAPFWKKEQTPDGARWVDARVTDDAALQKWQGVGSAAIDSGADRADRAAIDLGADNAVIDPDADSAAMDRGAVSATTNCGAKGIDTAVPIGVGVSGGAGANKSGAP